MTELVVGGAVRNMVTAAVQSLTEEEVRNQEEEGRRQNHAAEDESKRRRRYLTPPKPCRVLVFSFCLMLLFLSFYLIHLLLQYIIKLIGDLDWLDKVKEIYTIYRTSQFKNETNLRTRDAGNK